MNTVNYSIFPPAPSGGPPQGHRPKRRRKNRDQRKKDQEKKKEKETETKVINFRKALFWTTLVSPLLVPIFGLALYGIIKLIIKILYWTSYFLSQVIQ
jgi:hypothetical protein